MPVAWRRSAAPAARLQIAVRAESRAGALGSTHARAAAEAATAAPRRRPRADSDRCRDGPRRACWLAAPQRRSARRRARGSLSPPLSRGGRGGRNRGQPGRTAAAGSAAEKTVHWEGRGPARRVRVSARGEAAGGRRRCGGRLRRRRKPPEKAGERSRASGGDAYDDHQVRRSRCGRHSVASVHTSASAARASGHCAQGHLCAFIVLSLHGTIIQVP